MSEKLRLVSSNIKKKIGVQSILKNGEKRLCIENCKKNYIVIQSQSIMYDKFVDF